MMLMKIRNKIVYGISGLLAFLPLSILVIFQSIFALEASYDSKLVINSNEITIVDIVAYDAYNEIITDDLEAVDEDGKFTLWSIIEATDEYLLLDFHGGKLAGTKVEISGVQFILDGGLKSELLNGVVYLQFKNIGMTSDHPNWVKDAWTRDFIEDLNDEYNLHYKQEQGTISFVWVKIITASLGTLIGIVTVGLVILRKSTKALVKRYWRVAVLVALIEGTIVLGFITWIVADIFQVFIAATIGWVLFIGSEELAKIKGYLDAPASSDPIATDLPAAEIANLEASIDKVLAKYRK